MNVQEVRSKYLLPEWMKADAYDVAMSEVVDGEMRRVRSEADLLTLWDHIDELPEDMLDELAWALHVEWYDSGADIGVKRELIRNSDLVHARKGTVAAVESVVRSYFGDGYLMEWFEYGGDPFHFKVFTTNPTIVSVNQAIFEDMLGKVKRHSAKLDSILIGLTGRQWAYLGSGARDFAYEHQFVGTDRAYAWGTAGVREHEDVIVRMGDTGAITPEMAAEAMR